MNPQKIIEKYYKPNTQAYKFLIKHSTAVTEKALEIAKSVSHLNPDLKFIKEAAMLHDIGIIKTNAPAIGCNGTEPYIKHGILGREILEKEEFPKHALVCERHIGTGLTINDIKTQDLPLPERDMTPQSIEEQIICFTDKFFSKNPEYLEKEKPLDQIREQLLKHGEDKVKRFEEWLRLFRPNN